VSVNQPPDPAVSSRPATEDAARRGKLPSRPAVLHGATRSVDTPLGRIVVTLNQTATGDACEVLVRAGKAGSDLAAFAEAIGRLCSLCLALPSPLEPARRLGLIADELGGIGGVGGPAPTDGARSVPDAVARVLADHVGCSSGPQGG